MHVPVGGYDPRDPLLQPVWRRLEAAGTPVVTHVGSGPAPGAVPFTGQDVFADVMADVPGLRAIIAHMGAPQWEGFLALVLRHERMALDTTMAFTDFFAGISRFPADLLETVAANPDRVVLGTDFPNIPYDYCHELASLVALGFDGDWLRAVCWGNAAAILGIAG